MDNGTKMSLDDIAQTLFQVLQTFKNGLLLVEDINKYISDTMPNDLTGAICTNRHIGVDIILHYQSIGRITSKVWQNVNVLRLHKFTDSVKRHKHKYEDKLEYLSIAEIIINTRYENGDKRFLAGGLKKGCFYFLGNKETDKVLIAEGFATAASLYEHTDHITIAAFDAGNLKDVAVNVKPLINRDVEIIICADNDESGIGEKKARDAALAVGGKYIIPKVVGHDFNDVLSTGAVA